MIRVLLVDDDARVCAQLTAILEPATDIEVVGIEHDGAGGVEGAVRLRPDVVLMDLRMPGVGGVTAIARIRSLGLATRVVALTVFDTDEAVSQALRAGADGYLLKSTSPRDMVNLVRVAAQGQTVLSPTVARRLWPVEADDATLARRAALDRLTDRELDVLRLLAAGRTNAEIGGALHLTEATVKGYVSRVLDKLGCANRSQAGLLAQAAGIG